MSHFAIIAVGLLLAFANGANDNFKGVATLFGSGTAGYRGALIWATATTALGSLAALVLARGLLEAFTGKGLVPAEVVANPVFPTAVALAAGLTVLAATRLGFPVSTTHALIGALIGAGLTVSSSGIDWERLGRSFLLPLIASPVLAVALAAGLYLPLRAIRRRSGVDQETCGRLFGLRARPTLDLMHYLSAGAVSFARGLNDTPKIAALLLIGAAAAPNAALLAVGAMIAVGGLGSSRKVAETMSHRVTPMNPGQGFTANLVTSLLVIVATRFGLPVSTTHVSCGSLFGIGAVTGQARWGVIGNIVLAWIVTLPIAAVLAWSTTLLLR